MALLREQACLSRWYPKLLTADVHVPRTEIVATDVELWKLLIPSEEQTPLGLDQFIDDMAAAVNRIGKLPCFLRTGHGSGKHDWNRTCFLALNENDEALAGLNKEVEPIAVRDAIARHVGALVEWSEMVDMMGLPTKVWSVRELLPLLSHFTAYNGMPVAREFRLFIENGQVRCFHAYWPKDAVRDGNPSAPNWEDLYKKTFALNGEGAHHLAMAGLSVAKAFVNDGAWSVDFAQHEDGRWFAIDMAPAATSWHWPACNNERRWRV